MNSKRPATVVVLDDQRTSRTVLSQLLRTLDWAVDVVAFEDGLSCLDWAKGHAPDLVLADYKMSGLNGIDFTRTFRALPHCLEVPVLMVTGLQDRDVRIAALEAGATDFLVKPVDHHECRARCHNLLVMHYQRQLLKHRADWLEVKVSEAVHAVHVREREMLLRLAKAGEYRDEDTGRHVDRMARYSRIIADGLGLAIDEREVIELAAPMHDIGKIGIPDEILLKPGAHTSDETRVMRQHTVVGYEILKGSPSKYLQTGALIALHHHERYDGSGYPNGLTGESIPLPARIVAVADVFDAMTSVRPYKQAWPVDDAIRYIKQQVGKHFDPPCADAFLRSVRDVRDVFHQLSDTGSPDAAGVANG
jgi:two-component system, response regulator RpfG